MKTEKETTNSRVQRMIERSYKLGCSYCGPNSGCNARKKGYQNDWKSHRKNQWRD